MPLPSDYEFSQWVIQSKMTKLKPAYVPTDEAYGASWDATQHFKPRQPNVGTSVVAPQLQSYENYMQQAKAASASFNYTRPDKLKVFSNIILDLHQADTTLETLDKMYDIQDGFQV
jgi:hypothetical protein